MSSSRTAIAAAIASGALLLGAAPARAALPGKALFQSRCAVCHNKDGSGGKHFGDAVSADLRAPGLENVYHHDDKLLLRAILTGRDEDNQPLDAPMPKWKGTISDQQAKEIVTYLKTLCCNKGQEQESSN